MELSERLLCVTYTLRGRRAPVGLLACPHANCTFVANHPIGVAEHSLLEHDTCAHADCAACAELHAAGVERHEPCLFDGCSYVARSARAATARQSAQRHTEAAYTHLVHYALCGTCAACRAAAPALERATAQVIHHIAPDKPLPSLRCVRHQRVRMSWPSVDDARRRHPGWRFVVADVAKMVPIFGAYHKLEMTYAQMVHQTFGSVAGVDAHFYGSRRPVRRTAPRPRKRARSASASDDDTPPPKRMRSSEDDRPPPPPKRMRSSRINHSTHKCSASCQLSASPPARLECDESLSSSLDDEARASWPVGVSSALTSTTTSPAPSSWAASSEPTSSTTPTGDDRALVPTDWLGEPLEPLVPWSDETDDMFIFGADVFVN